MAVYTHVATDELARVLDRYDLGRLEKFEAIPEGVENSNFHIFTTKARCVLTLFERRVVTADIPFFLALMSHLAAKGVPAPAPIADRSGAVLQEIAGRPAVLVSYLEGAARMRPTAPDCRALGAMLARLHEAGAGFAMRRDNDLAFAGWRTLAARCAGRADEAAPSLGALIAEELETLAKVWPNDLPEGVIHADLFPDNVFFREGGAISGLIDFYFACNDFYGYDLAVALNSWCWLDRVWRAENAQAMIAGYESVRPLARGERAALAIFLRGAALRFLLTRLYDFLHQVEGAVVRVKDPLEYRDLLLFHRGRSPA
ncbi:MAG TPA: homoserine kinase [Parvularculaceae bacterium]|nr:homoserine kinase [Parvularculaceae bacterium]